MKLSGGPKISVIMSVYNGMPLGPQSASWRTRTASSAYLRQAVESIIKQTYRNFEFIIVDDDSTDETWDYLKSLKDPRVKLIKNKKNFPYDALSFSDRLFNLLKNETLYKEKSRQAQALTKNYNWEQISTETESIYFKCISDTLI